MIKQNHEPTIDDARMVNPDAPDAAESQARNQAGQPTEEQPASPGANYCSSMVQRMYEQANQNPNPLFSVGNVSDRLQIAPLQEWVDSNVQEWPPYQNEEPAPSNEPTATDTTWYSNPSIARVLLDNPVIQSVLNTDDNPIMVKPYQLPVLKKVLHLHYPYLAETELCVEFNLEAGDSSIVARDEECNTVYGTEYESLTLDEAITLLDAANRGVRNRRHEEAGRREPQNVF